MLQAAMSKYALADPAVTDVMVNPDGKVWIDCEVVLMTTVSRHPANCFPKCNVSLSLIATAAGFGLASLVVVFCAPNFSSAQSTVDLTENINKVVTVVQTAIQGLAAVGILYGAFQTLTGRANIVTFAGMAIAVAVALNAQDLAKFVAGS
jgi:hypothetical protein